MKIKKILGAFLSAAILISCIPTMSFASNNTLRDDVKSSTLTGTNSKKLTNETVTGAQMSAIVNQVFGSAVQTYTAGEFNPDAKVTCEQALLIIARAFRLDGGKKEDLAAFKDAKNVSSWAAADVAAVVKAGYYNGTNNMLRPTSYITSTEIYQVINNIVKLYISETGSVTSVPDNGSVLIRATDVTLSDVAINGDLIIGGNIGSKTIKLNNVRISGKLLIRGDENENLVEISGSTAVNNVIIAKKSGKIKLQIKDTATVGNIGIVDNSKEVVLEGTAGTVGIQATEAFVCFSAARIKSITIEGKDTRMIADSASSVENITVGASAVNARIIVMGNVKSIIINALNASVMGNGKVDSIAVNSNYSTITTVNTMVLVASGAIGTIVGEKPVQGGSTIISEGSVEITPTPTPTPTAAPVDPAYVRADYPAWVITPNGGTGSLYVAKNGNDSNAGTIESPFLTVQKAVNSAVPGDTIYIREGVYNERVMVETTGTEGAWITIRPYQDEKAVMDNNGFVAGPKDVQGSAFDISGGTAYLKITGLELRNYCFTGIYTRGGGHHLYFENLNIHGISNGDVTQDNGTEGLFIACNNVLIRNCEIYNIGYQRRAEHDHGIYFYAANDIVIDSNNINGVPGGGLHLYCGQDAVRSRNYLIINNIFENNKYGMVLTSAGYLRVVNNTFINNWSEDLYMDWTLVSCLFQNNIFYNDYKAGDKVLAGVWNQAAPGEVTVDPYFYRVRSFGVKNNVFCNNVYYSKNLSPKIMLADAVSGSPTYGSLVTYNFEDGIANDVKATHTNDVYGNPGFVDAAGKDFRLYSGSFAVEKGLKDINMPLTDKNGAERETADAGAFAADAALSPVPQDDTEVTPTPAVTVTPTPAANMDGYLKIPVANSSFEEVGEDGLPVDWSFTGNVGTSFESSSLNVTDGTKSVKLIDPITTGSPVIRSEKTPITGGKTYRVTADCLDTNGHGWIYLVYYADLTGDLISVTEGQFDEANAGNPRLVDVEGQAPAGANYMEIWVMSHDGNVDNNIYFDNVQLFEKADVAITNASFEEVGEDGLPAGWTFTGNDGTSFESSALNATDGTKSVRLVDPITSGSPVIRSDMVEITGGCTYRVTADVTDTNGHALVYMLYYAEATGEYIAIKDCLFDEDNAGLPRSIVVELQAPADANYVQIWLLSHDANVDSDIYFDNVRLVKTANAVIPG